MGNHNMKLSDPIMIGYPAKGEPILLGCLRNHDLPEELFVGTPIHIHGKRFTLDVSYVPHNPKKERLIPLLVPKEELPIEFWAGNAVKFESVTPTKEEEYPF